MTIGSASLSGLPIGTHRVTLKLNKGGVRLLKQAHTLHSTAPPPPTCTSGSITKTVRFAVTLKTAKPKKNKKK